MKLKLLVLLFEEEEDDDEEELEAVDEEEGGRVFSDFDMRNSLKYSSASENILREFSGCIERRPAPKYLEKHRPKIFFDTFSARGDPPTAGLIRTTRSMIPDCNR